MDLGQLSPFLEYGDVAYQSNGNKTLNNMLVSKHTPLILGVGQKVIVFSLLKEVMLHFKLMLHIKLKGKKCKTLCK